MKAFSNALLVTLAAIGAIAHAQDSGAIRMHIDSMSLTDAVNQWAQKTGYRVVWSDDASGGVVVPQLDGLYTPRQALERILRNTHLQVEFPDAHTAIIGGAEQHAGLDKRANVRLADSSGPAEADSGASSEASTGQVSEVIVTAEKRAERLLDVPVPVTVVNAIELTDNSQVLLRDYYLSVPGFNVTPNFSGDQNLSIRGITTGRRNVRQHRKPANSNTTTSLSKG